MFRLQVAVLLTLAVAAGMFAQETLPQRPKTDTTQETVGTGDGDSKPVADPESLTEKASFLIGYNLGRDFVLQQVDVDFEQLIRGIREAAADKQLGMSTEEINSVMEAFQRRVARQMHERGEENKRKGLAFLKQNALQAGVKELEDGLQYIVVSPGSGESPTVSDKVKIHYKGSHLDGKVFESTLDGEPVLFNVRLGIRGFGMALQRMKVGGKWKVFIPGDLAYGMPGNPPDIGPNETLVFEIELVEIIK